MFMSNIYTLVAPNRVLSYLTSSNEIVMSDFNAFRFFLDTLYEVAMDE